MDIKIRFWSDDECQVTTPCYDSNVLTCSNAENSNTLVERMNELCNKNCIMLLMDGPNTNWSVLDKVSSQLKQIQLSSFFEVCCYWLHTVYGGFQTGAVLNKWHLGKVLHAMWKLFKDSPVRRDNCKTINGSVELSSVLAKLVGLKMRVAAKAIEIWPSIVNCSIYLHFEGLLPSKWLKNGKSCDTWVTHSQDKSMPAKLQFFRDVTHMLGEFLTGFQTCNVCFERLFRSYNSSCYEDVHLK